MIPSPEQFKIINETGQFILEICGYPFDDEADELLFAEERIKEIIESGEDLEAIRFAFPASDDYFYYEVEDYINDSIEIRSINFEDKSLIKTNHQRFYIVHADDDLSDYYDEFIEVQKGIKIRLINESFFIGIAATALEEYEEDWWGTFNQYLAIHIIYDEDTDQLDSVKERDLVDSYLFEICDITNISIFRSEIFCPYNQEEEILDSIALTELEQFNEGMNLFISAIQINDPELKFLSFYKVIEHFSPVAINIEAFELMRKKLDTPKNLLSSGDYIKSIFELANSIREQFNDEDLIKASFKACIDFVGLYNILPESLLIKIKKQLKIMNIDYSTDIEKINTARNMAAKVIYKTRNKVVHAKSNFTLSGDEIPIEDFYQLNIFMKRASSQAIRWYSRQPEHLKLEVVSK